LECRNSKHRNRKNAGIEISYILNSYRQESFKNIVSRILFGCYTGKPQEI
jgi:hypothetical protein